MSIAHGKYHIWTVGCQMNQADSQRIASILDDLGWDETPTMESANLVVLNTCSVREQPEKRAHGQLSLLKHAKKHRADLLVAMMGCMIGNQRTIDDLKTRYPVVDLFFKVENADILPQFLEERWTPIAGEGCVDFADLGAPRTIGIGQALSVLPMPAVQSASTSAQWGAVQGERALPMQITPRPAARDLHYPTAEAVGMRSRGPTAWLPVVLGCNKVCSYCIVPARRGVERSRPVAELLTEAHELVDSGARELTLLGQTVEAYGLDLPEQNGHRVDLGDLMEQLSALDGLERIRFMTSYPRHMTDKMIQQMAALPKVCEHINIPVQHGDDRMLQRMRRGYTLAEYRTLIEKLHSWWPGVSLSTDVIVGFCGETEEEFGNLIHLLEEIRFDVVHVAAYSPRPGTLAYKWQDDVPAAVKKERLHAVERVQERIAREINATYQGRVEEVLIEAHQITNGERQWRGRTRTNKLVFCPATKPGVVADADALVRRSGGAVMPAEGSASFSPTRYHGQEVGGGRPGKLGNPSPGALVHVLIEKATPWSLQGHLATR